MQHHEASIHPQSGPKLTHTSLVKAPTIIK